MTCFCLCHPESNTVKEQLQTTFSGIQYMLNIYVIQEVTSFTHLFKKHCERQNLVLSRMVTVMSLCFTHQVPFLKTRNEVSKSMLRFSSKLPRCIRGRSK